MPFEERVSRVYSSCLGGKEPGSGSGPRLSNSTFRLTWDGVPGVPGRAGAGFELAISDESPINEVYFEPQEATP